MSLAGTTRMPSAGFPRRAILCITLCLSSLLDPLLAQPAFADPLDAMKAREYLNKGNNHLTRLEFQLALDAYTECLLYDPNNRIAKDNIVLTHNNWGIYWFQKNKFKEARSEWEQALKLNPNDRNVRNNMNILNFRIKQLGLNEDGEKKAPPPPPKATGDFPPSQVIILTPGIKNSSSSGASAIPSSGAGSSATGQSADAGPDGASNSGSGAVVILNSSKQPSATTSGGDTASGGGSSTSGTGSSGSSSTTISTYGSEGAGKFTTAPMTTPPAVGPSGTTPSVTNSSNNTSASSSSTAPAATAGGSQEENIGDTLGLIEQKIYGRKQDSLPIMKRLEKLEIDTHGKTKSGTIKERIDTLRKSYGF